MPEKPPEIKAVFFDIGNVLLRFDAKKVAAQIAWALRRHPMRVAHLLWTNPVIADIERGKITSEQVYERFQLEFGYKGSFAQFKDIWCRHFTLMRANYTLLQKIALQRRVYLLSNTNAMHFDFIKRRYAFPGRVHGAILSHEVGLRKPEPGIYAAAVKLAGIKPQEGLFIDDLLENVQGAERFGLRVIHHTKGHDLRAALAALGLP